MKVIFLRLNFTKDTGEAITWVGVVAITIKKYRDVTTLEFEFDECLSDLSSNENLWKNPCSTTHFICTDSQRAQTNQFSSQIQPIIQTTGTVTYE